ncbi:NAD(P)/FAD-dependent oxidoreductase [Microlunatus speluncae]|uniref:NAD(P)/FAD-dependent oxidoreductase n=1 Tax=Microlunatus speluncae TaxID=2594267 RepID=UPI0012661108|nr:FAD-dependent oxidoreductase [Microlunatus speluncae]
MAARPRVAVIGAGVIGTAVAAELAGRDAAVTLFESGEPGSGTSGLSFAWVNSSNKHPADYHALNAAGLAAHHRMLARGADAFVPNGRLEFATEPAHAERLDTRVHRLTADDYPAEWISPEQARALEPMIMIPADIDAVAWFPTEGHCWPDRLIKIQLAAAAERGARLRSGERVRGIDGPRLRLDTGTEDFDVVAVCAGRWTGALAATAGVPIPMIEPAAGNAAVGYLAETAPLPRRPDRVIMTSAISVRPARGGGLLLQALELDDSADPAQPAPDRIRPELARRLAELLPAAEVAITVRVGQRSLPADGLPIAGFADPDHRLYLLASHSGVTLAPLLGELAAREILGEPVPELAPYRPDRFREQRPTATAPRQTGSQ